MDQDPKLFNVIQILNLTVVGKPFKGIYTEMSSVNDSIYFKHKIIINLPNSVFENVKTTIENSLAINNLKCSSILWKKDRIELLVDFTQGISYPNGESTWIINQIKTMNKEICFIVEQLNPVKNKKNLLNEDPLPQVNLLGFQWQDVYISGREMFRMATLILIVCVNLVSIVLEFVYKVLLLLPNIIDSLMPLFINIVNGITKIVGGFYLLLLTLRHGPPPARINQFERKNEFLSIGNKPRIVKMGSMKL